MNHLILTEGKETEPDILSSVLTKYGFNVVTKKDSKKYEDIELSTQEISNNKDNVIIAKAPRNRLRDLLRYYDKDNVDLDKVFSNSATHFSSIFLVFDVDHTSNEDLENIFSIHNDETDKGLLLVSSPCIEILSETNRDKELHVNHLSEYKKERNIYINDILKYGKSTKEYIIDNFEKLVIYYLDKNTIEFDSYNVSEHPELAISKINKENTRSEEEVIYRYFTTVIYVAIAKITGLDREMDNYNSVKEFFMKSQHKGE